MHKKINELIMRIPNPFNETAKTRLANMNIIKDGQINQAAISTFADVFTGLFFDDICDFYNDAQNISAIYETFVSFYEKANYRQMYLFFSIQYDYIRKPLPDPVWWIAGNSDVVEEFMKLFMARYKILMIDAGFVDTKKESDE